MMSSDLEEEKKKLERKKKKLRIAEQIIKERERRSEIRRHSEIGRLAQKAKIDMMDHSILLGAFLEIAEKSLDPNFLETWKKKAVAFQQKTEESDQEPLAISFQTEPSKRIRDILKGNKFRWNSFRGEYYGLGKKAELETLLSETEVRIEVIPK